MPVDLDLVSDADSAQPHQDKDLIDAVGVDERIGQNGVDLFVTDPATFHAVFKKALE